MKFFMLMQHLSVALFVAMMGSVAQAKSLAHDSSYQVQDEVLAEIMQLIHHEETAAEEITSLLQLLHEHYPEVYQLVMMEATLVADSEAGDSEPSFGGSPGNCYYCRDGNTSESGYEFNVKGDGAASVGGKGTVGVQGGATYRRQNSSNNSINCVNTCKDLKKTYTFD